MWGSEDVGELGCGEVGKRGSGDVEIWVCGD